MKIEICNLDHGRGHGDHRDRDGHLGVRGSSPCRGNFHDHVACLDDLYNNLGPLHFQGYRDCSNPLRMAASD